MAFWTQPLYERTFAPRLKSLSLHPPTPTTRNSYFDRSLLQGKGEISLYPAPPLPIAFPGTDTSQPAEHKHPARKTPRKPEHAFTPIFPARATNPVRRGSYDLVVFARKTVSRKRSFHVSHPGCCAGPALAWRLLRPACEQLSHSPATHLRTDLYHHELRRRQASSLTRQ